MHHRDLTRRPAKADEAEFEPIPKSIPRVTGCGGENAGVSAGDRPGDGSAVSGVVDMNDLGAGILSDLPVYRNGLAQAETRFR
jgi:hypothetical protein